MLLGTCELRPELNQEVGHRAFFFNFFLLMAISVAYVSSWAGVISEQQLQAYTTAMAMLDPSCICNLRHSLWQPHSLNPLTRPETEPTLSWT